MDPDSPERGTAVCKEGVSTPCKICLSGVMSSVFIYPALLAKVPLNLHVSQLPLPGLLLYSSWILIIAIKDGMHRVDNHDHPVPE